MLHNIFLIAISRMQTAPADGPTVCAALTLTVIYHDTVNQFPNDEKSNVDLV